MISESELELPLIVSIVSMCGFASALAYNVYEFRKVGKSLDELMKGMRKHDERMREHDERMAKVFDRMAKEHDKMMKMLDRIDARSARAYERMTREHEKLIEALNRINASLKRLSGSRRRKISS